MSVSSYGLLNYSLLTYSFLFLMRECLMPPVHESSLSLTGGSQRAHLSVREIAHASAIEILREYLSVLLEYLDALNVGHKCQSSSFIRLVTNLNQLFYGKYLTGKLNLLFLFCFDFLFLFLFFCN